MCKTHAPAPFMSGDGIRIDAIEAAQEEIAGLHALRVSEAHGGGQRE
jgi:hypothetical protein